MAQNEPKRKSRTQQAVDLVSAGTHSKADAARAVGISKQAVCKACCNEGIGGFTQLGRRAIAASSASASKIEAIAKSRSKVRAENISFARPGDDIETLHFVRGLSYGDISELLGMSRGAVAGKIDRIKRSRARQRQLQRIGQEVGQ
ncbi:MAG: hypothetical protein E6Q97_13040 [Desulfurellales bacterium]|nr:MAG: hypothetical protein E6Q97_13040 [Desulfurellales bacterium]